MLTIALATLNARYFHASLGLRYLYANLGDLQSNTRIMEFIINQRPIDIVETLLREQPKIVGFGVYIWNVEETRQVVALIKQIAPDIVIVLGGPEVSYEYAGQAIVELADYLITGPGDVTFAALCRRLLAQERPAEKAMPGEQVPLAQLALPYADYTDEDIAHRLIYVEASRGCPFKCEFCLSSLDKTAWPFELERFLAEMDKLYQRGARHFKFIDRTFNLNIKTSLQILEFFLARLDEKLFLHFEIIPDHLPDKLKEALVKFPPGSLQFEIGIQSFNPEVQALISRKQDNRRTEENLLWLRQHTHAHIHADLIVGLPGEDIVSFAAGFDRLLALNPHEIQVGILKRLRGTPIIRHTESYQLRYNPQPPYNILCSDRIDFSTMQRLNRFARYWDLIGNSGRFFYTRPLLLGAQPFDRFMQLSDWLFATTKQTHQLALDRLFDLVYQGLISVHGVAEEQAFATLYRDYQESGFKGAPKFLQTAIPPTISSSKTGTPVRVPARQLRHIKDQAHRL